MEEQTEDTLVVAITGLMQTPYWEEFEKAIEDRRNQWLEDTAQPAVYQNHAELTQTVARANELSWLQTIFTSCRARIKS